MFPFRPPFSQPTEILNYSNFLNTKEISLLAKSLRNIPYTGGALADDDIVEGKNDDNIRKSRIKWIPFDNKFDWIYSKIMGRIHKSNSYIYNFNLEAVIEQIQYTEYYGKNKGHYTWHIDLGKGTSSHRKLSTSIQLSSPDEYEGGELEIYPGGETPLSMPKELGMMTIFPSYLLHRVAPVKKGIRRSLVLWVGGCQFK